MDELPEELLRVILVKHLAACDDDDDDVGGGHQQPPRLSTLALRFAETCGTCREFRSILMDNYTHERVGCRVGLDELAAVVPRLRANNNGDALSRLFDTYIGRLDVVDDVHDVRDVRDVHDASGVELEELEELEEEPERVPRLMSALSSLGTFPNVLEELNITAPEGWRSQLFDCGVLEEMTRLRWVFRTRPRGARATRLTRSFVRSLAGRFESTSSKILWKWRDSQGASGGWRFRMVGI
jgi:hypothetical protein